MVLGKHAMPINSEFKPSIINHLSVPVKFCKTSVSNVVIKSFIVLPIIRMQPSSKKMILFPTNPR